MRSCFNTRVLFSVALAGLFLFTARAQDPPPPDSKPAPADSKPNNKIQAPDVHTRITVEVTGGDNNVPIDEASVYMKYVEEHAIKKNKKLEINVKTNRDGVAHVPDAPMGRALVQIVADGWKPYGRWYDINDPKQVIKIHLQRPPKWY